jgi:hypothetical protein
MPIQNLRERALRQVNYAPATTVQSLRLLTVAEAVRAEHTKNAADKHLSQTGQTAKTRAAIVKLAQRVALSEKGIERERAARKSDRDATEQKVFEKYHADAMGPEIRAALKPMMHGEKIKLAAEDPRILAALVVAPSVVHGIAPDALAHLIQRHLEQHHPADLKRLDAKDEAIVVADSALRVTREILHKAGGFEHQKVLDDWIVEHGTPSELTLQAEAAGRAGHGQPAWSMTESFDVAGTDVLTGLPK